MNLLDRRNKENEFNDPGVTVRVDQYEETILKAIHTLSGFEQTAIQYRYLSCRSIAEVATKMGLSWEGANEIIDTAIGKVINELKRGHCAANYQGY